MTNTDTIAAAATVMGSSGIGIIRVSGDQAFSVAELVFRRHGKSGSEGSLAGQTEGKIIGMIGETVRESRRATRQTVGEGHGSDRIWEGSIERSIMDISATEMRSSMRCFFSP